MMVVLSTAEKGDVILMDTTASLLLQACCHNPCGADLTIDQSQVVSNLCNNNGLLPLIDMAESSRVNLAGNNENNLDYLVEALATGLQKD